MMESERLRVLAPKISAVTRVEAGSTAQNFTVKLIQYVLEGIGDGGFKVYKGTNSIFYVVKSIAY